MCFFAYVWIKLDSICCKLFETVRTLWSTRGSRPFGRRCWSCIRLWLMWLHWGNMSREYPPEVLLEVLKKQIIISCLVGDTVFCCCFSWQTPPHVQVPLPGWCEAGGRPQAEEHGANRPLRVSSLSCQTGVQQESVRRVPLPGSEAHRVWHHWIQHPVRIENSQTVCERWMSLTDTSEVTARCPFHNKVLLCRFGAGDVVNMRPCNAPEEGRQFCQLLRLDPDARFTLRATDSAAGWYDPPVWPATSFSTFLWTSRLVSSSQPSSALHRAPPGGELPGHRRRASPLLLWAAVHVRHQRAGAGEAGGVQLGRGSGRAAQLLQPAAPHRAGGDHETTSPRAAGSDASGQLLNNSDVCYNEANVVSGFISTNPSSVPRVEVHVSAGFGGFPKHDSRTQSGLSPGSVPWDPASSVLHRLLAPGNSSFTTINALCFF